MVAASDVLNALHMADPHPLPELTLRRQLEEALGKPREAQELFKEALTASPWIVGAWKDLGDLYYGTYEMGTTWQCWETGRRLHPTQKQFDPVRQFERKLAADHPEFF